MLYTYKTAIININGIAPTTKLRMLGDFLQKHDTDIILLQEVTHDNFDIVRGYVAMVIEGTDKRSTALLAKEGLSIDNIKRIPSGRGIAARFLDRWIISVYDPTYYRRTLHMCY